MGELCENWQLVTCKPVDAVSSSSRDWKINIVAQKSDVEETKSDRNKLVVDPEKDPRAKSSLYLGALRNHFISGKVLVKKKVDKNRCRLLELPAELRVMIYSYVFSIDKPSINQRPAIKFLTKDRPLLISYNKSDKDQFLPSVWFIGQLTGGLALFRTCRLIYNESSKVWSDLEKQDRRAQVYHLLRPRKLTRCDKCPSRLPWNSQIRCDRCNEKWKDSLCKQHIQPVSIFFALSHCPACQWNAYASKRKLPWFATSEKAKQLYVFKASGAKDLANLLKDSYVYGDEGAKSKHFARIRVKYKPYMSDKELYTRHYQYFLAWRGELLRAVRATRGQGQ